MLVLVIIYLARFRTMILFIFLLMFLLLENKFQYNKGKSYWKLNRLMLFLNMKILSYVLNILGKLSLEPMKLLLTGVKA